MYIYKRLIFESRFTNVSSKKVETSDNRPLHIPVIILSMIDFISFNENPNGNCSFLLKEIAIRRKLGRGASCVGVATAIISIYVLSHEDYNTGKKFLHAYETYRRDHTTYYLISFFSHWKLVKRSIIMLNQHRCSTHNST